MDRLTQDVARSPLDIHAFSAGSARVTNVCAEPILESPPVAQALVVSFEDRKTLERWVRMPTAPQRLVLRSRIVLMLAEGCPAREVARRLGVSRPTVGLWRQRYQAEGCDALTRDRPGRGRKHGSRSKGSC